MYVAAYSRQTTFPTLSRRIHTVLGKGPSEVLRVKTFEQPLRFLDQPHRHL